MKSSQVITKSLIDYYKSRNYKVLRTGLFYRFMLTKSFSINFENLKSFNFIILNSEGMVYRIDIYDESFISIKENHGSIEFNVNIKEKLSDVLKKVIDFLIGDREKILTEVKYLMYSNTIVKSKGYYSSDSIESAKMKLLGLKHVGYRIEILRRKKSEIVNNLYDIHKGNDNLLLRHYYPCENRIFYIPVSENKEGDLCNYYDECFNIYEIKSFRELYMILFDL